MKDKFKGIGCLLLTTMIWGSAFSAQSVGMDYVGPFTFQAVRCFIAVIGMLPLICIADLFGGRRGRFFSLWKDKTLWRSGLLCGIPLFLACNLQQVGLMDTGAGKSAFLTAMYVVIVPVLGLFLTKKCGKYIPVSVVISVAGLYLLSGVGGSGFQVSDLLLLGCAFMFSIQILMVDRFAPQVDALRLNTIQALVCAVLSSVCMFFFEKPEVSSMIAGWLPLCYAGLISMGLAYGLQIIGQKNLDPAGASLLLSLEAVFAAIFAWILLKQTMSQNEIIGSILILIAIVIAQIPEKQAVS